ncbi:acyl-CoA dehydrogenase [Nonomuraea sp. MG754425]|uniref:acyl-CoA dehydrogenase family protein n=1 Tax=Nonomuraea sp. MG754425 TaxID=2570319 RepID=UPI001F2F3002|nr:acyl-CoA dehydrogenase family protein [Nonomuraea sp. MG754425]MCF6469989.1 acyl-CoA dehydrogenase [Nonomuraea sp. MG754425]
MREWSDGQRRLRESFAEVFSACGEGHLQRDQGGEFPHAQWKLLAEQGLLRLPFDEKWGGRGEDLLSTMHVLEGLGYGCRDSGLNFAVSTHVVSTGVPVQAFGSDELKARYLPSICDGTAIGAHAITERHGGSDATSMRTTATREGEVYLLNGEKCFVSSGPVADLFLVYAKTDVDQGMFGMTAFVVERDTPGFEIGPPIDKMGLRTSPFCNLTFTDCAVPAANVVGRPGRGYFILDHVMKWEILCSFIISIGAARHRLERCVEFARSRLQFGASIGSCQLIADKIVDMRIGVETAARWLYDTAERFAAGEDVMVDIAISKLLASEANLKSAADAVQVFGARGYLTEYGIEKDLRDATGGTIYSGTSEVQRDKIARMLGIQRP